MKNNHKIFWGVLILFLMAALLLTAATPRQADDPNPPDHVVKLIFIHHSTGENWLRDDYGGLGQALADNNYFVSDTNYGWGPDSIGDRTDIPNWTEWFASANTPTYMDALLNESGQNSEYTRLPNDPGGENQIVMFKSCFPNSDLGGNPDDPPGTYEDMTVSGAKYVYKKILQYFATRPDKLFIVITAPPVSNPEYSANARAFNNWLLNNWLQENDYPYNNVAIFDFYNILTDHDAHHWYHNGQIERILGDSNTLAYPSDDDHPSVAGSQKATEEFIPMLNIFYHRWQEGSAQLPPVESPPPSLSETQAPIVPPPSLTLGLPVDFETDYPYLVAYWDEATTTQFSCAASNDFFHGGANSLRIDLNVVPGSWATCVLSYDDVQDWSNSDGISFYLRANQAGIPYDVNIYSGSTESQETYLVTEETPSDSAGGWAHIELPWSDFVRAAWEENAGTPFTSPDRIMGIAFGFSGIENANNTGTIWVDDITLVEAEPVVEEQPQESEPESKGINLPCVSSLLLPLMLSVMAWIIRRK